MIWGGGIFPKWQQVPVIPGHEFFGEVVAIGNRAAEKHELQIGDYAIAEQIVPCGTCRYCQEGLRWLCIEGNIHGHIKDKAEGGMAEYMRFSANDVVHKVSQGFSPREGAMIEPLSCAVHTIELANIGFSDVVVVAGLGPIGLCKLQVAKMKRPFLLVGIDLIDRRLDLAKELGADIVLNPRTTNVVEEVGKITKGYGCDTYIHSSGSSEGVLQGLQMLKKGGIFVEFSVFMENTSLNWSIIGDRKELKIFGAHISGSKGYQMAIDLLKEGIVRVDKIITHEFRLVDFKKAFSIAENHEESIKVILYP
jgi:L-iditol 2-dehydrogenase